MLKSFTRITLLSLLSIQTFACVVESNGKEVEPKKMKLGQSLITNENTSDSIIISCGPFEGSAEGFNRIVTLKDNQCTVISNNGVLSLFTCEE